MKKRAVRKISLLLILVFCLGLVPGVLRAESPIVDFGDKNVKAAVNRELGQAEDADVREDQMAGITKLDVENVSSLKGLEFCSSLTKLTLYRIKTGDLGPITGLSSLQKLELSEGGTLTAEQLTALQGHLNSMTKLQNLTLYNINLTSLEGITGMEKLSRLNVSMRGAGIESLDYLTEASFPSLSDVYLKLAADVDDIGPLKNLKSLRDVRLDGGAVADLTPLAALSGNIELNSQKIKRSLTDEYLLDNPMRRPDGSYMEITHAKLEHPDGDLSRIRVKESGSHEVTFAIDEGKLKYNAQLTIEVTDSSLRVPDRTLRLALNRRHNEGGPDDDADLTERHLKELANYIKGVTFHYPDEEGLDDHDTERIKNLKGLEISDLMHIVIKDKLALDMVSSGFKPFGQQDNNTLLSLELKGANNYEGMKTEDLAHLSHLKALKSLMIQGYSSTRVSDISPLSALTTLEQLHIQTLRPDNLDALRSMPLLEGLSLYMGNDDGSGCASLAALENLKSLRISNAGFIDDEGFALMSLKDKPLEALQLFDTAITDLEPLNRGENPETKYSLIYISGGGIADASVVGASQFKAPAAGHAVYKIEKQKIEAEAGSELIDNPLKWFDGTKTAFVPLDHVNFATVGPDHAKIRIKNWDNPDSLPADAETAFFVSELNDTYDIIFSGDLKLIINHPGEDEEEPDTTTKPEPTESEETPDPTETSAKPTSQPGEVTQPSASGTPSEKETRSPESRKDQVAKTAEMPWHSAQLMTVLLLLLTSAAVRVLLKRREEDEEQRR